jgi:serine/threonine-protein kinase RsbW
MSDAARGPTPLMLRIPAPTLPARLPEVRGRIAAWATAVGFATDTVDDIVLATHEALANVADHAYPDGRGDALLYADCHNGTVRVVVRDQGRWRDPTSDAGWRGRGLVIIHGLAEHVVVQRGDAGTRVEMCWQAPTGPVVQQDRYHWPSVQRSSWL